MTLAQMPFLIPHVIPDQVICTEIGILMDLLANGDKDPMDVDLTDLAVQYLVRDLIHEATNLDLSFSKPRWSLTPNGDVEVVFPFAREADAMVFKMVLPQ